MGRLTHLDAAGAARMIDVSGKATTPRIAVAEGRISMSAEAAAAIRDGAVAKGDVLATARIAGLMAAKRTAETVPLCHPLPLAGVEVALSVGERCVTVTATARTAYVTGVEMEAMTAVSVALLTVYDMAKSIDKAMVLGGIRLLSKTGGKDRKSTRLNSSHANISYAVFCLKKKLK